jgi:hypothetical protein
MKKEEKRPFEIIIATMKEEHLLKTEDILKKLFVPFVAGPLLKMESIAMTARK